MSVPVAVLATVDPVVRDLSQFCLVSDLPGTGVLRHDLDPVAGTLRRVVSDGALGPDGGGVVDDHTMPLAHTCLGCAIREDLLPSLGGMSASGRWRRILVVLPVAAELVPVVSALDDPATASALDVRLFAAVAAGDADRVKRDLLGADLLADRGLALAPDDRRSVGEALAAQVEYADLVLAGGADPGGLTLLDHLRGVRSSRADLFTTRAGQVFLPRHDARVAAARVDPRLVVPADAADPSGAATHGVWTLDLHTRRPLHPDRFREQMAALLADGTRSRGRFQLATRPRTVGEWDGVGGQLSIGDAGGWQRCSPSTRVIVTGAHPGDAARRAAQEQVRRAFAAMTLDDRELSRGPAHWASVDDGLDPWLGRKDLVDDRR